MIEGKNKNQVKSFVNKEVKNLVNKEVKNLVDKNKKVQDDDSDDCISTVVKLKENEKKENEKENENDLNENSNTREVDLVGSFLGKKTKKYALEDKEITKVKLENDIVVKLVSNDKGVFIDVRKYYKGYPTKRGIRFAASKLLGIYKVLKQDILAYVPDAKMDLV